MLRSAQHGPPRHHAWSIQTSGGNDALAVGGPMLYVATGDFPNAKLSAYRRATGRLVNQVRVPASPRALRIGPGGSVWLTFYPDRNGGGTGLWLLSPDLRQRSRVGPRIASSIGLAEVLPVGAADALVAGRGLSELHMPVPGFRGTPTLRSVAAMRADHGYGGAVELTRLGGRVALLQEDVVQNFRVVFAGAHGPVFDPGRGVDINSMASDGNGLWITTGPQPAGPATGAVIRLNDRLRDVTPPSLRASPVLAFPDQVWATGDSVVVTTQSLSRPLVCFRFRNGPGPVTTIAVRLPPGLLALAGRTIYAADASGVIAYQLPATCR